VFFEKVLRTDQASGTVAVVFVDRHHWYH
jgi:hypothetical protein